MSDKQEEEMRALILGVVLMAGTTLAACEKKEEAPAEVNTADTMLPPDESVDNLGNATDNLDNAAANMDSATDNMTDTNNVSDQGSTDH